MENLTFDLSRQSVRELNQHLHGTPESLAGQHIEVVHPDGAHNIAVGINAPVAVTIKGQDPRWAYQPQPAPSGANAPSNPGAPRGLARNAAIRCASTGSLRL